jgi:hypothetical protein
LDEEPYNVWSVKPTSSCVIKHLCFQKDESRFYCGEGNITFSAYFPYAKSRYEYIEDYTKENIREWIDTNIDLSNNLEKEIIYPAILEYDPSELEDGSVITFQEWFSSMKILSDVELNQSIPSYIEIFDYYQEYGNKNDWELASEIPSKDKYCGYVTDRGYHIRYNAGDIETPFKMWIPIHETP